MSKLSLNSTHDPQLRSWVESANRVGTDFPIQNLPFAVFRVHADEAARCGVGIGDFIFDVSACQSLFTGEGLRAAQACAAPTLNALMALGNSSVSALRHALSALFSAENETQHSVVQHALHAIADVQLLLPVKVAGYTDFFASIHHATNAGRLFRPDAPLLPNYKYVPVGYNGRASSVRVSGARVQRPWGQLKSPTADTPVFAPATRLDHEVELGMYIGAASQDGSRVPVAQAWEHIFGFSLLNDWSARDIQSWEYQPLGPFLAKSFATSVSPWVVTSEALAPFRVATAARPENDPPPLPHLLDMDDQRTGGLSIQMEATLSTERMRQTNVPAQRLSLSNTETLYWSFAQMLAHHTSNGSPLEVGDLMGSGTVSGHSEEALGSLLEITRGGAQPLDLAATGEQRTFLQDGDELTLRGRCERDGYVSIGFGTCVGTLLPASEKGLAQ